MFSSINHRNRLWTFLVLIAIVAMAAGGTSALAGKYAPVATQFNHERAAQNPDAISSLVNVTPSSPNGWTLFFQETATGSGAMVTGPATPPIGSGSANLVVNSTGGEGMGIYGVYGGTRLADITSLQYSTYVPVGQPANLAIALQFDIDFDVTDVITNYQGRLVYEPYNTGAPVVQGTWQTWNPLAPGNKWWGTGSGPSRPLSVLCPIALPCTMSQILTAYPNAGIHQTGMFVDGVIFKAGGGWTGGFTGNVDNFHIVTSALTASNTTYNFDPDAIPDAYGHLDPQAASGPGYEAYATQAWALANTHLNLDLKLNSGNANNKITAGQNYMGFDSVRLKNVAAGSPGCTLASTFTDDITTFNTSIQNEVCNGPGTCTFGQITVPAGSMAYASGINSFSGVSGDFRVAEIGLCTQTTLGDALITWQNDVPNNRDSFIEDELFNHISTFASYTGYTVHVTDPLLVGHVKWQDIPQPDPRTVQPITVTVKSGTYELNLSATTDASGFFTVSLGSSPSGTYTWRAKGPKSLANTGSMSFNSANVFTRIEMDNTYNNGYTDCSAAPGCMRGGDANNDNRVNISDYNILRSTFGLIPPNPSYDARADFDNNVAVSVTDFNILRSNFGIGGAPPVSPGGSTGK